MDRAPASNQARDLALALAAVAAISALRLVSRELEAAVAMLFAVGVLFHAARERRTDRGLVVAGPVVAALGATALAFVAMRAALP